jgi:GTP:adenosylcobinamide-phosphate guanylyltransferase
VLKPALTTHQREAGFGEFLGFAVDKTFLKFPFAVLIWEMERTAARFLKFVGVAYYKGASGFGPHLERAQIPIVLKLFNNYRSDNHGSPRSEPRPFYIFSGDISTFEGAMILAIAEAVLKARHSPSRRVTRCHRPTAMRSR